MSKPPVLRVPKATRLHQILETLDGYKAEDYSDYETGHGVADSLLQEVIRLIAPPEHKEVIEEILFAYERVGKWYA